MACRQNVALDNFLQFSQSPLIISIYKRKKFLHTQQSPSSPHLHTDLSSTKFICISSKPLPGWTHLRQNRAAECLQTVTFSLLLSLLSSSLTDVAVWIANTQWWGLSLSPRLCLPSAAHSGVPSPALCLTPWHMLIKRKRKRHFPLCSSSNVTALMNRPATGNVSNTVRRKRSNLLQVLRIHHIPVNTGDHHLLKLLALSLEGKISKVSLHHGEQPTAKSSWASGRAGVGVCVPCTPWQGWKAWNMITFPQ